MAGLKGFFAVKGTVDLPLNWNIEKQFGFMSSSSSIPIFERSLSDIMKVTRELIDMSHPYVVSDGVTGSNFKQNVMYYEGGEWVAGNANELDSIVVTADYFTTMSKIVQYMYDNQKQLRAGWGDYGDSDEALEYANLGDYWISKMGAGIDQEYAGFNEKVKIFYQEGSFSYTAGTLDDRVSSIHFTYKIFGTSVNNNIEVSIYFNPDDYYKEIAANNYGLYFYEDTHNYGEEGYDVIDPNEFKSEIVEKLHEIQTSGGFPYLKTYPVRIPYRPTYVNDSLTFMPETLYKEYDSATWPSDLYHTFYIFSFTDLNLVTETTLRNILKNLLEVYFSAEIVSYTGSYLAVKFPTLFTDSYIEILPAYTNTYSTSDGTPAYAHTMLAYDIHRLITSKGYTATNTWRYAEVINIGYDSTNINTVARYTMPFVILDSSLKDSLPFIDSYIGPLTISLPSYSPTVFNTLDLGQEVTSGSSLSFQLIIYKAMQLFLEIGISESATYDDMVALGASSIEDTTDTLDFIFRAKSWRIHKPIT